LKVFSPAELENSIPNEKNSGLGEERSPFIWGVGGYDLRDWEKKFLIGVGFEKLLELQDLQNIFFLIEG
jgi:hypothetical protein